MADIKRKIQGCDKRHPVNGKRNQTVGIHGPKYLQSISQQYSGKALNEMARYQVKTFSKLVWNIKENFTTTTVHENGWNNVNTHMLLKRMIVESPSSLVTQSIYLRTTK